MNEIHHGVLPLTEADERRCGGKARGLARLIAGGFRVPEGRVLLVDELEAGALDATLAAICRELGEGALALRSSALDEDSHDQSFAGQYESVLGIAGAEELRLALERCRAAAASERVRAYAGAAKRGAAGMALVVQRMVEARRAGALFTLDPVTGESGRFCIEAVAGLGEALVSGQVRPDRYLLDPDSGEGPRELTGAEALLDDDALAELLEAGRRAREHFGCELDLEWAIDAEGRIHWLQARPITAAGSLPLDELDTVLDQPSPGFCRYNVGEILPGAITPLSATTSVAMVDRGFRRLYRRLGVYDGVRDRASPALVLVSGHLFMNMRGPYLFSAKVGGANKEDADRSLAGRVIAELEGLPKRGPLQRAWLGSRLLPVLRRAAREVEAVAGRLEALTRSPAQLRELEPEQLLARVEELFEFAAEVAEVHLLASTWSGLLTGIIEGIVGRGEALDAGQRRTLARLLQGIGEVESADIGSAVNALAEALRDDPRARERLREDDDEALLAWLRGPEAGRAGRLFCAFLERHGHRCIRELELRERDWAEDPRALLRSLRVAVAAPPRAGEAASVELEDLPLSRSARRALGWLLPKSHDAIRLRERCKSIFVRSVRMLKASCATLAEDRRAVGELPEADLIYFLIREELPKLVRGDAEARAELVRRAGRRRRVFARQATLRFPMVSRDKPEPLPPTPAPEGLRALAGTPVSPGVVEGRARVIRSLEQAVELAAGEILIVPFTDAGWTPLFTLAAGLATEIGGTLSHGAVVARELGLPAVVDLPDATRVFETGQRVRLDADRGRLELLEPDEPEPE